MKIGFVGTKIRMDLVRSIVPEFFADVEAEIYVDDGYLYNQKTADYLLEMCRRNDGIVFGGELQYDIYQDLFSDSIPCTFIRKEQSSLVNALLHLTLQGVDISRISFDNFSYSTIRQVLQDAGVSQDNVVILRRRAFRSNGQKYYEDLFQQHCELYQSGKTNGSLTTLSFVYQQLCEAGIPAAYLCPTTDNVIKTISHVQNLYREMLQREDSDLAILLLRVTPQEELSYQFQGDYVESHEKLKAAEEIHYFAKGVNAAVVTQSDDQFTILISRRALMEYTDDMQTFPLLHFIRDNSKCNFSLGIGFGNEPGDARANAVMALKKACQIPRDGTYIVYSNKSIAGPMKFMSQGSISPSFEHEMLKALSTRAGISEEKLSRIYTMVARKKQRFFTVRELADYLNLSVRAANRIAFALEDSGLAHIFGQTNNGHAGRPSNVFEILFDLE